MQRPKAVTQSADELHGAGDPEGDPGKDMGKPGHGGNGQTGTVLGVGARRNLEHLSERRQDRDEGEEGQRDNKRCRP